MALEKAGLYVCAITDNPNDIVARLEHMGGCRK